MGDDTSCGELLAPVRVMELIVRFRPTTEGRGASSPVTKTAPGWTLPEKVAEPLPPPQPTTISPHSATNTAGTRNRFMNNSYDLKRGEFVVPGGKHTQIRKVALLLDT